MSENLRMDDERPNCPACSGTGKRRFTVVGPRRRCVPCAGTGRTLTPIEAIRRYARVLQRWVDPHTQPTQPIELPELDGVEATFGRFPAAGQPLAEFYGGGLGEMPMFFRPDGTPILSDIEKEAMHELKQYPVRLAETTFARAGTMLRVSTVYLRGINHAWDGGPPTLWETMIFHERRKRGLQPAGNERWRYRSTKAALDGHRKICAAIRAEQRRRRETWKRTPS